MAQEIKGVQNSYAKGVPQMKYKIQSDPANANPTTKKVRKEKVVIRDEVTGKIYGSRVIVQNQTSESLIGELMGMIVEEKDGQSQAETALKNLQGEALPEMVISELKSLIRKGAKDMDQAWKNALELTQRAYAVAAVRLPGPYEDGQWKQYEELLSFAVKQLAATRGLSGDWRLSALELKEAALQHLVEYGRLIVDIPGEEPYELTDTNVDDATTAVINKLKRHGFSTKVLTKDLYHSIVTIYKDGKALKGNMTIRNIS